MNLPLYASNVRRSCVTCSYRATEALRALQTIQGQAPDRHRRLGALPLTCSRGGDPLTALVEPEDGEPDETEDEEAEGDDGDIPRIPETND